MITNIRTALSALGGHDLLMEEKSPVGKRARILYRFYRSTPTGTEADAARLLGYPVRGRKFARVQEHLLFALVNNLTMVRPGQQRTDDRESTRRYVWKLIAVAKRLSYRKDAELRLPFLTEAFALAEKAGLILPAKLASELLAYFFSREKGAEHYEHYRERSVFYQEVCLRYRRIRLDIQRLERHLTVPAEAGPDFTARCRERLKEHRVSCRAYPHPGLRLQLYYLELKLHQAGGNYAGMIELSLRALAFLEREPNLAPGNTRLFEQVLGTAYLLEGAYREGLAYAERSIAGESPGEVALLKLHELRVLLLLRLGEYARMRGAFRDLERVITASNRKAECVETVTLFGAYLHLLEVWEVLPATAPASAPATYSLKRSENYYRRYGGDPAYRYHFDLVAALLAIAAGKYTRARKLIGRLEYTDGGPHRKRYGYFNQLLQETAKQRFHPVAVARHTQHIQARLRSTTLTVAAATTLIEVVPYEVLWELVKGQLAGEVAASGEKRGA